MFDTSISFTEMKRYSHPAGTVGDDDNDEPPDKKSKHSPPREGEEEEEEVQVPCCVEGCGNEALETCPLCPDGATPLCESNFNEDASELGHPMATDEPYDQKICRFEHICKVHVMPAIRSTLVAVIGRGLVGFELAIIDLIFEWLPCTTYKLNDADEREDEETLFSHVKKYVMAIDPSRLGDDSSNFLHPKSRFYASVETLHIRCSEKMDAFVNHVLKECKRADVVPDRKVEPDWQITRIKNRLKVSTCVKCKQLTKRCMICGSMEKDCGSSSKHKHKHIRLSLNAITTAIWLTHPFEYDIERPSPRNRYQKRHYECFESDVEIDEDRLLRCLVHDEDY